MSETSPYANDGTSPRTMAAARLVEPRRIEVEDAPVPDPGPTEVRVKIEGCGVCASNLPPFEGREWFSYPMDPGALGHEAWGHVDAVGSEIQNLKEGDRVAMLSGKAYAQYDVADEGSVVPLPASLEGLPFPGEPLGCAVNIFRRSDVREGQTVAIVGVGFLGALLVQMAKEAGARVIAVARRPFALEVARQMGADETVEMGERWQIAERVKEITGGAGADVVIEAVGKQEALDVSTDLTKEMGRLIIAGYHQDGLRSVNLQTWNWNGLDVITPTSASTRCTSGASARRWSRSSRAEWIPCRSSRTATGLRS